MMLETDPWRPFDAKGWQPHHVVHLHRRAAFRATWQEIERDARDGPDASVRRLLEGTSQLGVPKSFEYVSKALSKHAIARDDVRNLQAWWIYRMLAGTDPLRERLALAWHDHFATSQLKVRDLKIMHQQNQILRSHALAPFPTLLEKVAKDPALLLWLDAETNRSGHPNENLAREIMELFTLGIGNFTERDVKEAARALTGWTVRDRKFADLEVRHDAGDKLILGRKGPWRGDDLLHLLLDNPATSRRIAARLCEEFLGPGVADNAAIWALAAGLREHDFEVRWAVETILRSELFYAEDARNRRVVGPAEFVIGAIRALEFVEPMPRTALLADALNRMGLALFRPPNVGGWNGGEEWLSARALVARTNFVSGLISGATTGRGPLDALSLVERHGIRSDIDGCLEFFATLLFGKPLLTVDRDLVANGVTESKPDEMARQIVGLLLAAPAAHIS